MRRTLVRFASIALLALATAGPAFAADHEVKMLNRSPAGVMVFEPAYLKIKPGDTVTFVPTDPSHNAEAIQGMAPNGAVAFKGGINKAVTVVFEAPGVYGYKCAPHYAMGMVGIIVVGDVAPNLGAAGEVKHPGKAQKIVADLLTRAKSSAASQ